MEEVVVFKTTRSASCPNPETLGLLRVPRPPADPPSPPASVYSPTAPRSPPEPRQNVSESVQVQTAPHRRSVPMSAAAFHLNGS